VNSVIFVASLSDYDQVLFEDEVIEHVKKSCLERLDGWPTAGRRLRGWM
jgi:hypothetical protein